VLPDPIQEELHRLLIGAACVLIADLAVEEFLRREDRIAARSMDDGGQVIGDDRGKIPRRGGWSTGVHAELTLCGERVFRASRPAVPDRALLRTACRMPQRHHSLPILQAELFVAATTLKNFSALSSTSASSAKASGRLSGSVTVSSMSPPQI